MAGMMGRPLCSTLRVYQCGWVDGGSRKSLSGLGMSGGTMKVANVESGRGEAMKASKKKKPGMDWSVASCKPGVVSSKAFGVGERGALDVNMVDDQRYIFRTS